MVLSCDSVVGLVNMFFLLVTLICSLDQKPGLWQFSEPPCHWWWWQMDVGDLSRAQGRWLGMGVQCSAVNWLLGWLYQAVKITVLPSLPSSITSDHE